MHDVITIKWYNFYHFPAKVDANNLSWFYQINVFCQFWDVSWSQMYKIKDNVRIPLIVAEHQENTIKYLRCPHVSTSEWVSVRVVQEALTVRPGCSSSLTPSGQASAKPQCPCPLISLFPTHTIRTCSQVITAFIVFAGKLAT